MISWHEKYAQKVGAKINKEMEEMVLDGLEQKKQLFGIRYCPCLTVDAHSMDTVCPCKEFREENTCRCGLFEKE
jgi:ferredoxin-thioredoxin reductase catalytic subunit